VSESSDARSVDTVRGIGFVTEKDSMLGVSLSSPSRMRFARLKDLIDLYALNEIEEYLKQKESLVSLVSATPAPNVIVFHTEKT